MVSIYRDLDVLGIEVSVLTRRTQILIAMAPWLYNICDSDTANMFDTGKGHTILRTGKVISEPGPRYSSTPRLSETQWASCLGIGHD